MKTKQAIEAFADLLTALHINKDRAAVLQAFVVLCKACKCWGRAAFCQWAFKHDLPMSICRSVVYGKLFV